MLAYCFFHVYNCPLNGHLKAYPDYHGTQCSVFFNYEMCIYFLDWILLFLIMLRSPISLAGAV